MKITSSQIEQILERAPDGELHVNIPIAGGLSHEVHSINDLRELLFLRNKVALLEEREEEAFYNGYVRGVTFEKSGQKNHSEFLPEIAKDECRKYFDSIFNMGG